MVRMLSNKYRCNVVYQSFCQYNNNIAITICQYNNNSIYSNNSDVCLTKDSVNK